MLYNVTSCCSPSPTRGTPLSGSRAGVAAYYISGPTANPSAAARPVNPVGGIYLCPVKIPLKGDVMTATLPPLNESWAV